MFTHAAMRSSTSVRAIFCASNGAPIAESTTTGPVTSRRVEAPREVGDKILRVLYLDAAEALTQRAQLHRPQQPVRGLARAEVERDQGPEAAGLPPVHVVPGMVGEPRPIDLAHLLLL